MEPSNLALQSPALLEQWRNDGWLHLTALFTPLEVRGINDLVESLWRKKTRSVTVDDLDAGVRTHMSGLSDERRSHRIKINDLYLWYGIVRQLLSKPPLIAILSNLLGDDPVLCNTLNLERSSAQEFHADSLYMTPRTTGRLVAMWVGLETVAPGSGPLRLYPGSHLLTPYHFSNGRLHAVPEEMTLWAAHMQEQLDSRGSTPHSVMANEGDVVIWHADLLHGAEPISDPRMTRRSLVAHYFGRSDCLRDGQTVVQENGAFWLRRHPQPAGSVGRYLSALERRWWKARGVTRRLL